MLLHNNTSHDLIRTEQDNSHILLEVLSQWDTQMKVIESLEKLLVRFHGGTQKLSVIESMQGFGWVVLSQNKAYIYSN